MATARSAAVDKRRIILDAALKTFAARGYHGTTVPEVADAAGVGTGTLYRYFEHKEALVNEVYRDAKQRLKGALLTDLAEPDVANAAEAERWFGELWRRLATFARAEPDAFRFLEMQDHVEYLDHKSRALELTTSSDVQPIRMTAAPGVPEAAHGNYRGRPGNDLAVITLSYLPPAPTGQGYQLWARHGDRWTSLGVTQVDPSGAARLIVERPELATPPDALEVTLEPIGGSPSPTGPVVIRWPAPE